MKRFRIFALVLALLVVLPLAVACNKDTDNSSAAPTQSSQTPAASSSEPNVNAPSKHEDFTSVYETIGTKVTIDMVEENDEGIAFATVDGVKYELGMDFLSMAMVYNTAVPEGSSDYKTSEDVFNEWWKLYILRWNKLVPEVPLYSNRYYDVYNSKIEELKTSPYWGVADALVSATIKAGETSNVVIGNTTDLSGSFRNASWGKSSPGASDLDVQNLITGYSLLESNFSGEYHWNLNALDGEPEGGKNEDGTYTFTLKIKKGMKFTDGTEITAKNYIASTLANSNEVLTSIGGKGNSGLQLVGFNEFSAYNGTNGEEEGVSKYFSGVKLLDDYTFSVTYAADYADYYYLNTLAGFSPDPLALYLGDADVIVDEETKACGLSDKFYETKTVDGKDTYTVANAVKANLEWNSKLPFSGPYTIEKYDDGAKTVTLKINKDYAGDVRGKATIETLVIVKVVEETQLDQLLKGEVDVIAGITGGDVTKAAVKAVKDSKGAFKETHYDRAGYGKLAFRCDFGPTAFTSVRQAVMYTLNRDDFATTFTGGYGTTVHGPYYTGYSAYKANASELEEKLNQYAYSVDDAIDVLEADGWVYNVNGEAFDPEKDDVRYKKLTGYDRSDDNLKFATVDGKYKTVKIGDWYYMPLAINWYGTQPNSVTDQLKTAWQSNENATTKIGMYIQYLQCEFGPGVYGQYCRDAGSGYDGNPTCNAVNFATGFNSAVYDYAYYWTINPEMYDIYSNNYLMDEADFAENYK